MFGVIKILSRAALALAFALLALPASAQYPDKPVKLVVGFAAGGFTDTLARIVARELGNKWNQPVVVENKPGAGSNIAAELVAKSPADGYTLLVAGINNVINAHLYRNLTYDPVKDFAPIALMVATPNLLVVNPSVPANSVQEFIALVKAEPKRFNYGSTGIGSSVHLQGELFKSVTGIQMTHIPYKGSSQALTDLLAGNVQAMFDNYMFQLPQVKAGKVRALAITAMKRSAALPDVPTMNELGIAGFEMGPWFGLLAPAKTSPAIIRKVNADVNALLQMKEVQDKLAGAEIISGTLQQYSDLIGKDLAKWGRVIRDLNLKAE